MCNLKSKVLRAFGMFLFSMVLFLQQSYSQPSIWIEDFDGTLPPNQPSNWSVTPTGAWQPNTTYFLPGSSTTSPQSYLGIVPNQVNDSTILETGIYNCLSFEFVYLRFSHICKISPSDIARIEFRTDAGGGMGLWTVLPWYTYLGSAANSGSNLSFSAASYSEWQANDSLAQPDQSWWRDELFDLTGEANYSNVQFRFIIKHGAVDGTQYSYGWLLENFQVEGRMTQPFPPTVQFVPLLNDTLFYTAKSCEINAKVKTNTLAPLSRVPLLQYTAWYNNSVVESDSIQMTPVGGDSLWRATIPQFALGTEVEYSITESDTFGNVASANSRYVLSKPYPGATGNLYFAAEDTASGVQNPYMVFAATQAYAWSRTLYINSELTGDNFEFNSTTPVMISKMAWYSRVATSPNHTQRIQIYLQATNAVNNSTRLFIDPAANSATLVYNGPTTTQAYWNEVELTTPFVLPAGSNLMVYFIVDSTISAATGNMQWAGRATAAKTMYQYGTTAVTEVAMSPIMRFGIEHGVYGNNSVALAGVISPLQSTTIGGQNTPIKVAIRNRGNNDLDSCWIYWSLNDTLQTPYKWTGPLGWEKNDTLDIGNYISRLEQVDRIKMWCSMPNGLQDPITADDTLTTIIYGCSGPLSGNYTVGPGKDFQSLTEALYALSHCEASSDVQFLLTSGTYAEQWDFAFVGSTMNGNMLTITSEANHRDSVIIQPESGVIVLLHNTRNLRLEALTFNGRTTNAPCVQIIAACTNIVINNCNLLSDTNSMSTTLFALDKASGTGVVDSFRLTNCWLDGGYYCVQFYGGISNAAGNFGNNIVFDSNIFSNSDIIGLFLGYTYVTSISHNKFFSRTTGNMRADWYGLQTNYCNFQKIVGNSIRQRNTTTITFPRGFYFSRMGACVTPTKEPVLIANNEIMLNAGSDSRGFHFFTTNGTNMGSVYLLHNSVCITGTATSYCMGGMRFESIDANTRFIVKKNILHTFDGSATTYPIYLSTAFNSTIYDIDSNNYYAPTNIGYSGSARSTLAAWQAVVTTDKASTNIPTPFLNAGINLKLANYTDFLCDRDAQILEDIEGTPRGDTTSWGCYTNTAIYTDALLTNIHGMKPGVGQGEQDILKVELVNNGTLTITEATLCWMLNGVFQTSVPWSGYLAPGDTEIITLDTFTYLSGTNSMEVYICDLNSMMADVNPSNDTIRASVYVCTVSPISGTYSIPTDFANLGIFVDAVDACGVSGIITLHFTGTNGQYAGNLDFSAYASRLNNIPLIITGDTIYASAGDAVTLGNNRNLTFQNVVIKSDVGNCIAIVNTCTNIVIRYCTLLADPTATATTACINKPSGTGIADSIIIVGNILDGGYSGAYISAGTGTTAFGTYHVFDSNIVTNSYRYTVFYGYTHVASCYYNILMSRTTSNQYWEGINMNVSNGPVIGNRIIQRHTNAAIDQGAIISVRQNVYANPTEQPGLIANNELILNNTSTGISTTLGTHTNIINNSIYIKGTGSGRGININNNALDNITIKNNSIVMTDSTSYPIYMSSAGNLSLYTIDYNNLYAPVFAGYYGTGLDLAAWTTTTGYDSNSVRINPMFVDSSKSLELMYYYKEFDCPQHADVPNDIDNTARTIPTTMGAYESSHLEEYKEEGYDLEFTQLIVGTGISALCAPDYVPVQYVVSNIELSPYDFSQDTLALHLYMDGMKGIFDTVIYVVSDSLYTDQADTFNIIDFLDVSFAGDYYITAWISSEKDTIFTNDTLRMTYRTNKIAFPYSEDFSTPDMTNLVVEGITGLGTDVWKVVQGASSLIAPAQGTGMLVFDAPMGTTTSLRIGQIELERTVQPALDFWYAHDNNDPDPNSRDNLDVLVTWNGGTSRQLVRQIMRYDTTCTTPTWKQYTVDLSPYVDSACVMVHLTAYSYGGMQHIDKIALVSGQNLALDAILIDDYSACDLEQKEIQVIFSNQTNQSINFSEIPTDIVFEIRGTMSKDTTIVLSGMMEALATDTILIYPHFDFQTRNTYSMTAYINSAASDVDRSDDTTQREVAIYPDIEIVMEPITTQTIPIAKNLQVYQTVTITNKGNLAVSSAIPLTLEVYGKNGVLDSLKDIFTGGLPVGSSIIFPFTESYTVPAEYDYNVVVTAELACDADPYNNEKIQIVEYANLDDISPVSLLTPSGTHDTVGRSIQLEVEIANLSLDNTFTNVRVNAIISDGINPDVTLSKTVANLLPDTVTNCRFDTSYIVPDVLEYTITIFVDSVDIYQYNDTLTTVTRQTITVPTIGIKTIQNPPLSIYPNPTTGKVYLSIEGYVKVYTIQGKLLLETFGKEVDLSQYAQGMYFMQVNDVWCKVVKH